MTNKGYRWLTTITLLFLIVSSQAQISYGGKPMAFSAEEKFPTPLYTMPQVDPRIIEDKQNAVFTPGEKPYEFAFNHGIDLHLNNSGIWEEVKGGRIWRVSIASPGAFSLNLGFNKFRIPEGAKVFIYNADKTDYIGALTHQNNKENNTLSTSILKGDQLTIEYYEPNNAAFSGELSLDRISHDFVDMTAAATRAFGGSGACNMNVNCPDGASWQVEKRAVAMVIAGGSRACTGTLIANYAQDNTPYFLTANHCFSSTAATESWVFMFNYEAAGCTNVDGPTNQTVSNCTVRSRNPDSDFLLVELSALPPQSYNPYIAGFDKSGVIPAATIGIHHPSGDIKKISFDDDSPGSGNMGTAIANSEWQIYAWDRSTTTEPGSSGSGLWDNNYRLIGQLHGGQATCANSVNDYYGKISVSWDNGGNSTNQLKDWLDGGNQMTAIGTVDGYDPYAPTASEDAALVNIVSPSGSMCEGTFIPSVTIQNKGTNSMTTCTITYDLDGGASQTYNWSGNLATNATEVVTLTSMTATAGAHTFNAATSLPNGTTDGNTVNDAGSASFTAIAQTAGQALPFTEGFENATFVPTGWSLSNPESNATWSRVTAASGFGTSTASAKMDFFSNGNTTAGQSDYLELPTLDFSSVSAPAAMDFAVAYARYGASNFDSLLIYVSTDCGANYTQVYADGNSGLATVADQTAEWTATAGDWTNKSVDLSAYAGQSSILVRIEGKSGWGNNLYLDDINIYGTPSITADFTADVTTVCAGSSVTFTDATVGTPTGWNWTFNNGTPGTSTTQNPVIVYNTPGIYDVSLTVTDGTNNDTNTKTSYITVVDIPVATVTYTDPLCNGSNDGNATAIVAGGTSPYTYLWDDANAQTTSVASNLLAGTYTINITDANGCTGNASTTLTDPVILSATTSTTDASCGNPTGTATVTATGGTSPYTYLWDDSNTQTTATALALASGTYNVTTTDANNCNIITVATVNDQTGPTTTITSSDVQCNAGTDGSATVSATGGLAPYTYLWDDANAQTSATASNLIAGTYNVSVSDANGCSANGSITITEPTALDLTTSSTDLTCNNDNSGSASVTVSGGTPAYSYLWDDTGSQTTAIASGLAAGTYQVTVTDINSCSNSASVTITEPAALASTTSTTDVDCNGNTNGTTTITLTGGTTPYTYLWDDATAQTSATATGLPAGTFTVTATDANGCNDVVSVTIFEPAAITTIVSTTDVSCNNGVDGTITATVTGGNAPFTYLWDDLNGQFTSTATGLSAGVYNVMITDVNGCNSNGVGTISEPTAITLTESSNNADCGIPNGDATVSGTGGVSPYTYLWNDPSSQTTATATGLTSGTYNVVVTDANGCTNNNDVIVNANGFTVSTTGNNTSCNGGTDGIATASPSGGTSPYTYLWDDASVQTTATATGLSTGIYNVTVTDNSGCVGSASITITEPTVLIVTITSNDASCSGSDGDATATVSGGTSPYTYLWDDATAQTTMTATGLSATTYSVIATDNNGCTGTTSVTINNSAFALSSTSNQVSCFGNNDGDASVTVVGGVAPFSYAWDDSFSQTAATAINLSAGTYICTVTDDNACSDIITIVITEPTSMTATINSVDATCGGSNGFASVTASGGTSPYTYLWNDASAQTTATANNLVAGNYTVVTTDANGCSGSFNTTINNMEPSVIATTNDETCSGSADGNATATASGGTAPYSYLWDDASSQTTATANNLTAGMYNVLVTDINGCQANTTVTINSGISIIVTTTTTDATCGASDGTATASASGGTQPYTYLWDDAGSQTSITATGLMASTYSVNVTDNNGCSTSSSTVVNNTIPNVNITASNDASCFGANDGSATALASGGSSPYNYSWNDQLGQLNATASLAAGTYTVTVLDANGCSDQTSVTINEPAQMTLNTLATDVSCDGTCDGFVSVSASGGSTPYSYAWDDASNTTTSNVSNLCFGTYSVTVTDANGCQAATAASVNKPAAIVVSSSASDVTCNSNCNGSAAAVVTGGSAPYTYLWNDPSAQTTASANNLCPGTYTATIMDNNGCSEVTSVSIVEPSALNNSTSTVVDTCGAGTGSASVIVFGGTTPYSYSWDNGVNTNVISNVNAGNYALTVIDGNGCTSSISIVIDNLGGASAGISNSQEICEGNSAAITATGGNSYSWTTGENTSTITVTPTTSTTYGVIAIDQYGCESDTVYSTVSVSTPPTTLISSPTSICNGESIIIQASGGTSYNWNTGDTGSSLTVSPSSTTTYSAIASNGSCQGNAASTTITVLPSPTALATSNVTTTYLNQNGTVNFDGTTSGGSDITWNFGDGFFDSQLTTAHNYSTIGTYDAVLSVSNGACTATDTIVITVELADGIEDELAQMITVYPNPASGIVSIQLDQLNEVQVTLINELGQIISTKSITGFEQMDFSSYNSGIYFLKFTTDGKSTIKKLSILK